MQSIVNYASIQYDDILFGLKNNSSYLLSLSPRSQPRRGQTLEAEARTHEAEARTLEAEAEARTLEAEVTKFWPREASRPRPGLEV